MKAKITISLMALALAALVAAGCGSSKKGDTGSSGAAYNSTSSSTTDTSTATTDTTAKSTTPTGGASGGTSGGKAQVLKIAADPSGALKFDKSALKAKAGTVSIVMSNPSPLPHAVELEGNGVEAKGPVVNKGGTSTAKAKVKPGTYAYYCPVPGHRQAGMEGKLVVK